VLLGVGGRALRSVGVQSVTDLVVGFFVAGVFLGFVGKLLGEILRF
jgi:ABC-type lipoprotein release transport system permease subunit